MSFAHFSLGFDFFFQFLETLLSIKESSSLSMPELQIFFSFVISYVTDVFHVYEIKLTLKLLNRISTLRLERPLPSLDYKEFHSSFLLVLFSFIFTFNSLIHLDFDPGTRYECQFILSQMATSHLKTLYGKSKSISTPTHL